MFLLFETLNLESLTVKATEMCQILLPEVPSVPVLTHTTSPVKRSALHLHQQSDKRSWSRWFSSFSFIHFCPFLVRLCISPLVFIRRRASVSVPCCLPCLTGRRHAWWSNSQAGRPPPHRYTSWWQCWGSVGRGGLSGRGTVLDTPPLWELSAEFGRRSDTCCPPLVAVFVSPLQFESRRSVTTSMGTSSLLLWWYILSHRTGIL